MASNAAQMFAYRVQKDLKEVSTMQFNDSPTICAAPVGDRIDHVVALVMGPPACPYHCGFFFVELRFPPGYPNEPPKCRFLSSDNGRIRMNPNLYSDGKICLSILGTWRGETTEIWRGSYSTAYILQAIQCVIMNCDPFYNEPGFERDQLLTRKNAPQPPEGESGGGSTTTPPKKQRRTYTEEELDQNVQSYSEKITHETLRIAVCDVVEALLDIKPPERQSPTIPEEGESPQRSISPSTKEEEETEVKGLTGESGMESTPTDEPYTMTSPQGLTPVTAGDGTGATFSNPKPNQPTPAASAGGRHALLPYFQMFRNEILRQFVVRYESYMALATKMAPNLDGKEFVKQPFEFPNNCCLGRFDFAFLCRRLENIQRAALADTDAWRVKGRELTSRMAYVASTLADEAKSVDTLGLCVSGGPKTPENIFEWQFSIMSPEGLFEESMYTVTAVFHADLSESPKITFDQPIWHPNISPSGHPYYFMADNSVSASKRFLPTTIAKGLARLLEKSPNVAPTTWVNEEAAAQCFNSDPTVQREFKKKARSWARRTME